MYITSLWVEVGLAVDYMGCGWLAVDEKKKEKKKISKIGDWRRDFNPPSPQRQRVADALHLGLCSDIIEWQDLHRLRWNHTVNDSR
eukprot:TRINITY_DN8882_c0_g1_i1.p1 TRINITY_DN8882_c0_g1~~TRINITY_DN8882_c0_g1_i1.p1  ORF type:complete len:100 (-),score=18.91 TRINITY_DN8882_c0_g1_i1:309-566(-)